jgi:glycosyltransferase involved in cell wall biosynthesis
MLTSWPFLQMHNKLIYIANSRIPTEKAHGLAIMKMCEAFADNGVDVELVIPRRKTHISDDPFEYYGVKRNFKLTRLWCLDLVKFGWLGYWLETLSFMERVSWHVMFKKGILYTRDEFSAFYLRAFSKKVYWEAHTAKSPLWTSLLKNVEGVIAISSGLKDHYVSKGFNPSKIMVVHSGVDLSKFDINKSKEELRKELLLPLDKKIVAYIGKRHSMGENKGVEELESALQSISVENQDVLPLFVTDTPPRLLPAYMKASDILVMNYPNTEHYAKYMSPLKLFEYMASGTPIVTPDLPTIREVLNESSAYFFKPDNKEDLMLTVKLALKEEKIAQNRAINALQKISNYTWDNRAIIILEFIK